jgi:hypothetical protein
MLWLGRKRSAPGTITQEDVEEFLREVEAMPGEGAISQPPEEEELEIPMSPAIETAELVRFHKFKMDSLSDGDHQHRARLAKVMNRHLPQKFSGLSDEVVLELGHQNIVWVVRATFVENFRYSAIVRTNTGDRDSYFPVRSEENPNLIIWYTGDIPETVLDKAERGLGCGLKFLTVHSQQEFPVEYSPVRSDPVLLGWDTPPSIVCQSGVHSKVHSRDRDIHAVVLAVWDAKKEIDIL